MNVTTLSGPQRVPQAYDEYVKAWFVLKLLSKEFELGDPNGFILI